MTKNFNETWGFDFGGELKTYGVTNQMVLDRFVADALKDFEDQVRVYEKDPDNKWAWAALQAAYHVVMQQHNVNVSGKIDSGEYFRVKLEILKAAKLM